MTVMTVAVVEDWIFFSNFVRISNFHVTLIRKRYVYLT